MSAGPRSGQVTEAAGVNIRTLRSYERRGLPAEPERSNGGHRLHGENAVTAPRAIEAARRLGFTPEEKPSSDLTTIRTALEADCDDRRAELSAARLPALAQGAIGSCRLCSVRR